VSEGFWIPAVVKIVTFLAESREYPVSITLNLKSMKSMDFSKKKQDIFFRRVEPKGFKHIYKIDKHCDVIEQSHGM